MKKLFTLIALIFTMHFAQAQVADTLVYLRQIENNKSKYINQPVYLLLNDLKSKEIKPRRQ